MNAGTRFERTTAKLYKFNSLFSAHTLEQPAYIYNNENIHAAIVYINRKKCTQKVVLFYECMLTNPFALAEIAWYLAVRWLLNVFGDKTTLLQREPTKNY